MEFERNSVTTVGEDLESSTPRSPGHTRPSASCVRPNASALSRCSATFGPVKSRTRFVSALVTATAMILAIAPEAHAESTNDGDDAPASIDVRRVEYVYTSEKLAVTIKFDDLQRRPRTSFGVHLYQENPDDISSNQAVYLRVTPHRRLQLGYINVGEDSTSSYQCDGLKAGIKPRRDLVTFRIPRNCTDTAYPYAFGSSIEVGVASAWYSSKAWSGRINYLREPQPLWGDKGKATKADLVSGVQVTQR